ncbi:MAG TPA: KpsF/GutQ family sugar-phosphate isomerase [Thiotrichaceae bacterium]|jgi:arabinose-5-phosphate isomerase|nr:KpsF/GutQ family sugar-phosphate isomerase [Thiotrichaceae bacterium]HIM07586.1 KpsF/GutQ family sugar-phosphate isomerase [Gammaproteobacteria bacterium]
MSEISPDKLKTLELITLGKAVIETEQSALAALIDRIDERFVAACNTILQCDGRVIVIGMGKSGHIGNKIAATLASTGTPAFFVHPGEASHGDSGMITSKDTVMLLSNSGETDEVVALLPVIKRLDIPMIALTGNPESTLAKAATVDIDVSVKKEACPLGLAPTASTTATLAMGDAIAIALLEARGFNEDDFARSHPGGTLGRRLLLHVSEIMHTGDGIPKVPKDALLSEALIEMSQKGLGITTVVDDDENVLGIFTDGDLRRALDSQHIDVKTCHVKDVMTVDGKNITADSLAASALALMESHSINALVVVDDNDKLTGILNMHDLLRARVV